MFSNYSLFSNYKFFDIWADKEQFLADYKNTITQTINDQSVYTLWVLLGAKYGEANIANNSVSNFKQNVFSIIYMYGPAWEKRIQLQKDLIALTPEDIQVGNFQIYNHSFNPSTAPTTNSLEELRTINEQNTARQVKGKVEAIRDLWILIETDVTEEFLEKFRKLFIPIAALQRPVLYNVDELIENLGG